MPHSGTPLPSRSGCLPSGGPQKVTWFSGVEPTLWHLSSPPPSPIYLRLCTPLSQPRPNLPLPFPPHFTITQSGQNSAWTPFPPESLINEKSTCQMRSTRPSLLRTPATPPSPSPRNLPGSKTLTPTAMVPPHHSWSLLKTLMEAPPKPICTPAHSLPSGIWSPLSAGRTHCPNLLPPTPLHPLTPPNPGSRASKPCWAEPPTVSLPQPCPNPPRSQLVPCQTRLAILHSRQLKWSTKQGLPQCNTITIHSGLVPTSQTVMP